MANQKIPVSQLVNEIRSNIEQAVFLQKYHIDPAKFPRLLQRLVEMGAMEQAEIDLWLSSPPLLSFQCPFCGFFQPDLVDVCPMCAMIVSNESLAVESAEVSARLQDTKQAARNRRGKLKAIGIIGGSCLVAIMIFLAVLFRGSDTSTKLPSASSTVIPAPEQSTLQLTEDKWERVGIPESKRKEVYAELVRLDDTLIMEAVQTYPDDEEKQVEYYDAHLEQGLTDIAQKYGLTNEQLEKIRMEGLEKNWIDDMGL